MNYVIMNTFKMSISIFDIIYISGCTVYDCEIFYSLRHVQRGTNTQPPTQWALGKGGGFLPENKASEA